MNLRKEFLTTLLLASSASFAHAQWFIAPQLMYTNVDTSESAADFDNVASANLQGGYRFNDWLAATGGVMLFGESEESGETDAGSYELTLSNYVVHAGVQAQVSLATYFKMTFDVGLDLASVELEVEEDFFGIKPGGKDSIDDRVLGYHLGIGMHYQWSNFAVGPVLRYQQYPDLFDDDSNRPFDLKLASFGVEGRWQFD